jgi:integrase
MATLKRHGTKWQGKVYVGHANGKDLWEYPSWPGTLPKTEVNELLKIREGELASRRRRLGGGFDASKSTLADLWKTYCSERLYSATEGRSEETRTEYEKNWRLHLEPELGETKLTSITPKTVDSLVTTLEHKPKLPRGRFKPGRPAPNLGPLAPATVRKVTKLLASMLVAAIDWRWIDGPNPVSSSSGRAQVRLSVVHAPSEVDVRQLLHAAVDFGPDYLAYFRLATVTGARRGELCALTWRDIDLKNKALTISKATQSIRMNEQREVVREEKIATTKTGGQRIVPLDSATIDVLVELRRVADEARQAIKHSTSDSSFARAFVFAADPDGQFALSKGAWSARWRRVQKRAGIEGIRLHDLRHFVGVSLAKSGRPLREIMDQLGHKRLSTTEIYLTAPSSTAPADVMAGILLEPEVLATVRKPPATSRTQKAAAPAGARKAGVTTKRVSRT